MNGLTHRPLVGDAARAAFVTLVLAFSAPVLAQTPYFSGAVAVGTRDIDLTSPKGAEQLERRVNAAISSLCGQPVFGTRDEADAIAACRADARASAEPKMKATLAAARVKVATAD